jgi:hypothetical protein
MKRGVTLSVLVISGMLIVTATQEAPAPAMAGAAQALIDALDDQQRQRLVWSFDAEERFNWHFIPRERQGLPLRDLNPRQREAAVALLRTGLSEKGFTKAETIRGLEEVLRAAGGDPNVRNPELYFFTIFGEPGARAWAWRYEGHHLSQNWTIVDGRAVASTPAFFGANPAEVRQGPMKGTRALAGESDLAWVLLDSLTEAQHRTAVIGDTAPRDIITGADRKAAIEGNAGLRVAELDAKQRALFMSLLEEHASSTVHELARQRRQEVFGEAGDIRFAWMGATRRAPGAGYYYRIQGSTFLVEYDNTQNNANHQHVVWRTFNGDFGADVLGLHYAGDPHHADR